MTGDVTLLLKPTMLLSFLSHFPYALSRFLKFPNCSYVNWYLLISLTLSPPFYLFAHCMPDMLAPIPFLKHAGVSQALESVSAGPYAWTSLSLSSYPSSNAMLH
jgi:hypothetical protein